MKSMEKLAYIFLAVILIGLAVHVVESFSYRSFLGMSTAVAGLIGEICVFAVHIHEKKPKKFKWKISYIGVIAVILIVAGIIVNIVLSFIYPEYVGLGNELITWGFIIAVIGFFIMVVKEKGFKEPSQT